jgi:ABC-2 type transport system permease protein
MAAIVGNPIAAPFSPMDQSGHSRQTTNAGKAGKQKAARTAATAHQRPSEECFTSRNGCIVGARASIVTLRGSTLPFPILRLYLIRPASRRRRVAVTAFPSIISAVTLTLRKWWAVFSIFFQDGLAYRASGLIWITTDLVTAVTMPLVWASATQGGPIKGFTSSDFVLYYLAMLLLTSFITSHIMWELAMEIKEGQFSVVLVRPISFFQYTFFRNLAWRVLRPILFAPIFVVLLWGYRSYLTDASVFLGWEFWASVVLGHLLSFTFVVMMSMLALFVQEATSIFELYYIPMLFLSGQLFPVSLLPTWAQNLTKLFPFYFTTGAPTEILIGRLKGPAMYGALWWQIGWCVFAYLMARILWKKGLHYYTGVGM